MSNKEQIDKTITEFQDSFMNGADLKGKVVYDFVAEVQSNSRLLQYVSVEVVENQSHFKTVSGEVHVPLEIILDDIERNTLRQVLLNTLSRRTSVDLEELLLHGDKNSDAPFLSLVDGVLKNGVVREFTENENAIVFCSYQDFFNYVGILKNEGLEENDAKRITEKELGVPVANMPQDICVQLNEKPLLQVADKVQVSLGKIEDEENWLDMVMRFDMRINLEINDMVCIDDQAETKKSA